MIERAAFEALFNATKPVGPIEAPAFGSNLDIQRISFDENNELYKALNHGMTLIVGRKGSGKTAFLNSVAFEGGKNIVIGLDSADTADIFTRIMGEIDDLSRDAALVEQVANLWEVLIWGVVLKRVYEKYGEKDIGRYLDGLGILHFDGMPYEIIDRQIETIKTFPPTERPIPQKVRYTRINGLSFLEVKKIALALLKGDRTNAYVLMDSLEKYELHRYKNAAAVSGLLRCIGAFTAERTNCILRCCIPAEKYHQLLDLSQNPIKDFQGSLLLHWDAGDLIRLSAKRYAEYLRHYEPDAFKQATTGLHLDERGDAIAFWSRIFPKELENGNGHAERPLAYILRHTQLLPRHFLLLLTEVLSRSIKIDNSPMSISPRHIVEGVFDQEHKITSQILEAYSTPLGHSAEACKQILPQLRTHFRWTDFDTAIARRRGVLKEMDGAELMDTLIEIGAVGRYIGETKAYRIAVFEYMVPNRLVASDRDSFCVHPIFTERYNVDSKYTDTKPIYTYWSEQLPPELS